MVNEMSGGEIAIRDGGIQNWYIEDKTFGSFVINLMEDEDMVMRTIDDFIEMVRINGYDVIITFKSQQCSITVWRPEWLKADHTATLVYTGINFESAKKIAIHALTLEENVTQDMKSRGQSLVEFAIALPMLLILLLGTLDVGRMYFTWLALQNAAGEGAIYAAINPQCIWPEDGPECVDEPGNPDKPRYPNAYERAVHESSIGPSKKGLVDWSRITQQDISIEPLDRTYLCEGDAITITLYYNYDVLTPIVSPFLQDGKLRLRARAVQNIIDGVYCGR